MPSRSRPRAATTLALSLSLGACALLAACGGKGGPKAKPFTPGKRVSYENTKLGFAIQVPDNLRPALGADRVTFEAPGFPSLSVRLLPTKDPSTRGTSSQTSLGKITVKVYAPMRLLVCRCEDAGEHRKLVKEICRSLKHTVEAPMAPKVKLDPVKISGTLKNQPAYVAGLKGLEDRILQCWKAALKRDPKHETGHIGFIVEFKADGSLKQSNVTRTFNYAKDKAVTACVEKLFFSVRPEPDGAEVEVRWYLRFARY